MKKTILMTGTFDSKGKEFDYLYRELLRRGVSVIAMDVGVFAPVSSFPVAVTAGEVAKAGGASLEELRREADNPGDHRHGGRRRHLYCGDGNAGTSAGIPESMYHDVGVGRYQGVCGYQRHCTVPVHCGHLRDQPLFGDGDVQGSGSCLRYG